ncbi:hypothetical protein J2T02_003959 [Chitinophaga terrae (ex Kim and Jung 2007)]|uniref:DUF1573 domain-containing protein n=1 Tax=Chitinophaga terrae (ex Kim and Jung 2007) TaxID=408074 RepID=UPI0027888197|nr:DUF1573 domain-containing protein [Chitinophaga terrae (ex Kim and Jung 2007)]MDQ0108819.1 hypothetical protein [Chitinophaga terrae (ex Kim and Jung 2007)]
MRLLYLVVISMILLSVLLLRANFIQRDAVRRNMEIENERHASLMKVWDISLQYSGNAFIDSTAHISRANGEQILLSTYLKHKPPMLILRLSQNFCSKCLNTEIPKLINLARVIGKERILLLSNQSNYQEVSQIAKLKNASFQVIALSNADKLFTNLSEEANFLFPYFFTVDSTMIAKSIFLTDSDHPELSDEYYNIIKKRWEDERDLDHIISKMTKIEFEEVEHDFGSIPLNKEVTHVFKFKNIGIVPLSIITVNTSCGCTAADYTLTPIIPGDSSSIAVKYDAKTSGLFRRSISVISNAGKVPILLTIKGTVK